MNELMKKEKKKWTENIPNTIRRWWIKSFVALGLLCALSVSECAGRRIEFYKQIQHVSAWFSRLESATADDA